jgi:hypothetical protein
MALVDERPDTEAMLPFTSLDFWFLVVGALVLLEVFLRLRHVSVSVARRPETDY